MITPLSMERLPPQTSDTACVWARWCGFQRSDHVCEGSMRWPAAKVMPPLGMRGRWLDRSAILKNS